MSKRRQERAKCLQSAEESQQRLHDACTSDAGIRLLSISCTDMTDHHHHHRFILIRRLEFLDKTFSLGVVSHTLRQAGSELQMVIPSSGMAHRSIVWTLPFATKAPPPMPRTTFHPVPSQSLDSLLGNMRKVLNFDNNQSPWLPHGTNPPPRSMRNLKKVLGMIVTFSPHFRFPRGKRHPYY
jgi:hypothetical protein